jgi:hypothetical protein
MNAVTYRIFDIVYPEKRQLAQYFEQVTVIIFSVDLADSDRLVDQSTGTCLLQEDIAQFDAVCNSRCFRKTPVILYFGNTDYFYDKLNVPPLSTQFPDYQGMCSQKWKPPYPPSQIHHAPPNCTYHT